MAKSSADDEELRRACEAAIEGTKEKIVMSIRVAKSRGIWGKSGKLGRSHMAKPRVLAISSTEFSFLFLTPVSACTSAFFLQLDWLHLFQDLINFSLLSTMDLVQLPIRAYYKQHICLAYRKSNLLFSNWLLRSLVKRITVLELTIKNFLSLPNMLKACLLFQAKLQNLKLCSSRHL